MRVYVCMCAVCSVRGACMCACVHACVCVSVCAVCSLIPNLSRCERGYAVCVSVVKESEREGGRGEIGMECVGIFHPWSFDSVPPQEVSCLLYSIMTTFMEPAYSCLGTWVNLILTVMVQTFWLAKLQPLKTHLQDVIRFSLADIHVWGLTR